MIIDFLRGALVEFKISTCCASHFDEALAECVPEWVLERVESGTARHRNDQLRSTHVPVLLREEQLPHDVLIGAMRDTHVLGYGLVRALKPQLTERICLTVVHARTSAWTSLCCFQRWRLATKSINHRLFVCFDCRTTQASFLFFNF